MLSSKGVGGANLKELIGPSRLETASTMPDTLQQEVGSLGRAWGGSKIIVLKSSKHEAEESAGDFRRVIFATK
jgi:hypothetical protein